MSQWQHSVFLPTLQNFGPRYALAFHQLGCVHRDVRLPNVLVDGRGNWLLVDFELADVADQPLPADAIAFDAVAPEARPLGAPYTPADDVWQVGRLIRSAGLHLPSEAESLAAQLMAPREARLSTQAALAHPWLHDS